MDRAMWEQHLALTERHIAQAHRHIANQHQIVAELKRDGYDLTRAQELLAECEATLKRHLEHRDRLKADLETAN